MTSHEEGKDRDDSGPGPGGSLERNEGRDGVVKVPLAVALTLAREKEPLEIFTPQDIQVQS